MDVPAGTYLFNSEFAHDLVLIKHVESYVQDWVGSLRSNRQVTFDNEEMRVNVLEERIDEMTREFDEEIFNV